MPNRVIYPLIAKRLCFQLDFFVTRRCNLTKTIDRLKSCLLSASRQLLGLLNDPRRFHPRESVSRSMVSSMLIRRFDGFGFLRDVSMCGCIRQIRVVRTSEVPDFKQAFYKKIYTTGTVRLVQISGVNRVCASAPA